MNRNVINYLLHTTIKRAARQSPSYFDLLTSNRDHLRSTWWLDRLKDVEFDGTHSSTVENNNDSVETSIRSVRNCREYQVRIL